MGVLSSPLQGRWRVEMGQRERAGGGGETKRVTVGMHDDGEKERHK